LISTLKGIEEYNYYATIGHDMASSDVTQVHELSGSGRETQVPLNPPFNEAGQDLESALQELQQENERLRQGYASLTRRLIGLRMLQHISEELVSELDVELLLKRILRSAIHAVEGTAGALLLLDRRRQELIFAVVEGGGGAALEGQRMSKDQRLAS
jgi:hypothetical protein